MNDEFNVDESKLSFMNPSSYSSSDFSVTIYEFLKIFLGKEKSTNLLTSRNCK
jgi:hypothetical protein